MNYRILRLAFGVLCAACSSPRAPQRATADSAHDSSHTTASAGSVDRPVQGAAVDRDDVVRALYVNRFAAQSTKKMAKLIAIADSTEINALVVDVKDEFGLNYHSSSPAIAKNEGSTTKVPNLKALLDTLHAHHIMAIARMVTFKDSVAARVNPDHVIRKADGSAWRDKQGLTWVDPYDKTIWEYDIAVAEEMARMGWDEIQFDYIRFPEPYPSLPPQVFKDANGRTKPAALGEFLSTACPKIRALGARCTIDIFGLVTTVNGALEVGQHWETLSKVVDVVLPMTYPSHYPRGSFNLPHPNADPYKTIQIAVSKARQRDEALGVKGPEHVRPWLQAFTLGPPKYGPHELEEQKRAVYDAGYEGWVLWNPGSQYDVFVPALEKTLTKHTKASATR